jgi:poly-beta-1,6-N-acetyl-D-glucosamine N-deacetylase
LPNTASNRNADIISMTEPKNRAIRAVLAATWLAAGLSGPAQAQAPAPDAPPAATAPPAPAAPAAAEHAVVVTYFRFGENNAPATSIRLDQFEAHVAELKNGRYAVLPLPEIVEKLKQGERLPDRAVAITIDDAFASFYREGWPRLRQAGLPFTLFVTTDPIDRKDNGVMTWDQVREVAAAGAAIGVHSRSPTPMHNLSAPQATEELRRAGARVAAEVGAAPTLFAYPQGAWSVAAREAAAKVGFAAAFGQNSGAVHRGADWLVLPRFLFAQTYGDVERFRVAVNSLPLPITDVTPVDPRLERNPPSFGFTVAPGVEGLARLECYASHQGGRTKLERIGERRFEVRFDEPFPGGRGRVNCTLPGPDGRWRWTGAQFYVPRS